jgi:NAD(P)-dependent dehydrogenase (short-subunit alcohol dehydrogenase family)
VSATAAQGRLEGEIAIVTGAASGIGKATATLFAAAGASVLAVDRNGAGVEATAAEGEGIRPLAQDVAAEDGPAAIIAACRTHFGAVPTILFNNAGIGGSHAADLTEDDELDRFISVNLRSVFRLARDAIRAMLPAGRGSIVNTASVFGMTGFPGSSSYAATKAGVAGLTWQLASDYGPRGIRVNAIAPGIIRTAMTARNIDENVWYQQNMIANTPLATLPGEPDDIAYAALYLASREAKFVNGHVLVVDGGWLTTHYRPRE